MRLNISFFTLLSCLLFISACKHSDPSSPYVKVYKYDGSIQCESTGVELNVMALELIVAGIDVVCSQQGHDGLARITVCGADTGNINIYTIHRVNQTSAEELGFSPVNTLSEYQDQPCE